MIPISRLQAEAVLLGHDIPEEADDLLPLAHALNAYRGRPDFDERMGNLFRAVLVHKNHELVVMLVRICLSTFRMPASRNTPNYDRFSDKFQAFVYEMDDAALMKRYFPSLVVPRKR